MSSFLSSIKTVANSMFGSGKFAGKSNWTKSMGLLYQFKPIDIDGNQLNLSTFSGNVLLITNVACKCGYTKGSYDKMTELNQKYGENGLKILCFPCNQFMSQEPWNESEIKQWVTGKWPDLNAVLFSKIDVNGENTHPIYQYLKQCFPGDVAWNFATKFVVDKNGIPVQRFDKKQTWDEIEQCIKEELDKQSQSSKL